MNDAVACRIPAAAATISSTGWRKRPISFRASRERWLGCAARMPPISPTLVSVRTRWSANSGNKNSGGTLSVGDGSHNAALLGSYMALDPCCGERWPLRHADQPSCASFHPDAVCEPSVNQGYSATQSAATKRGQLAQCVARRLQRRATTLAAGPGTPAPPQQKTGNAQQCRRHDAQHGASCFPLASVPGLRLFGELFPVSER
jgi:hypothetical protein